MKRGRGDTLTGGTGDVSPQLLTLTGSTSAANTFTEFQVGLPIPRFALRKGKAICIEVLKVYWESSPWDANPAAGGSAGIVQATLGTKSLTVMSFEDPTVFSMYSKEIRGAFTAAGSYAVALLEPQVQDLTDGAGHGVLVATDNIFFDVFTGNFAGTCNVTLKMLYRWKEITVEEYIGIVQSQQ